MADKTVEIEVKLSTTQAEQSVDKLNSKLDQTKTKAENVNKTTEAGVSSISNWGQAFEKVLNEAAKGAGSLGGSLGGVTSTLKTALPIIKNINSTATAGLKAIKSGIASTGIGLLVVALGEIVSHWKEIAQWIGISTDKQNDYKTAVEQSNQAVKDLSGELDYQRRLQQAAGADAVTIAEQKVEDERRLGEELNKQYLQRVKEGNYSRRQIKEMQKELEKQMAIQNESYKKAQQDLEVAKVKAKTEAENKALAEGQAAAVKARAQAEKDAAEALKAQQTVYGAIKSIIDSNSGVAGFWENLIKPESAYLSATNLLERLKESGIEISEELIKDAINGNDVILREQDAYLQERIKRVQIAADKERDIEEKKGLSLWHTEEDRAARLLEIDKKEQEEIYRLEEESWDLRIQLARDSLKAAVDFGASPEIQNALETSLNLLLDRYKTFQEEYDGVFNQTEGTLQDFLDATQDALNLELSKTLESSKLAWYDYLDAVSQVGASVGSIFDSMVEAQKNQIEIDRKLGRLSEEQAQERLQSLMKYERAANIINTLSAIAKIFASPTEGWGPVGWAINAAQAAAVLAAGIARDRQIVNAYTPDKSSIGGDGGNAASVGATPLNVMNDLTPTATMNIPVSSEDTRVYLLESDVIKAGKRVQVRESQTTF